MHKTEIRPGFTCFGIPACQRPSSSVKQWCVQETAKQDRGAFFRVSTQRRFQMGTGLLAPPAFQKHLHSQWPPFPNQELVREDSAPGQTQNPVFALW